MSDTTQSTHTPEPVNLLSLEEIEQMNPNLAATITEMDSPIKQEAAIEEVSRMFHEELNKSVEQEKQEAREQVQQARKEAERQQKKQAVKSSGRTFLNAGKNFLSSVKEVTVSGIETAKDKYHDWETRREALKIAEERLAEKYRQEAEARLQERKAQDDDDPTDVTVVA